MSEPSQLTTALEAHHHIGAALKNSGLDNEPKGTREKLVALVAQTAFGLPMVTTPINESTAHLPVAYRTLIGGQAFDLSQPAEPEQQVGRRFVRPHQAMAVLDPQRNPGLERKYVQLKQALERTAPSAKSAQPA